MPILKARPYEGSPGFNQAWSIITRSMHTEMLAKPPARRFARWPDPQYYRSLPIEIPHAALIYNPSKRLRILSQVPRRRYTSKYTIQQPPEHYVEPGNLTFVPSPRLLELAQPRVLTLTKHRKSPKKFKPKHKNWEKEREEWLALRAAPKPIPPQPPAPKWKRRTTPLSPEEREIRIVQLSKPTLRYLFKPEPFDPYKVSTRSLRARATKRTLELAAHRELPEEALLDLKFKPYSIKKAALRYKPTKRIVDLAVPVFRRTAGNKDYKEDAFQVPARALKAICSKRTKELAKPVVRRGWVRKQFLKGAGKTKTSIAKLEIAKARRKYTDISKNKECGYKLSSNEITRHSTCSNSKTIVYKNMRKVLETKYKKSSSMSDSNTLDSRNSLKEENYQKYHSIQISLPTYSLESKIEINYQESEVLNSNKTEEITNIPEKWVANSEDDKNWSESKTLKVDISSTKVNNRASTIQGVMTANAVNAADNFFANFVFQLSCLTAIHTYDDFFANFCQVCKTQTIIAPAGVRCKLFHINSEKSGGKGVPKDNK